MENNNSSFNMTEFIYKNIDKIKILEKISISIFAIGLVLYFLKQPNTNFVLITGSILTAISYFFLAFDLFEEENLETTGILNSSGFINFIYKLTYISLSVSAIAMLGLVLEFKKGNSLLIVGGMTLVIVLVLSLLTQINDRTKIYNSSFYLRIIICLLLLAYLAVVEFNLA